jgi:hypothetical protein
MPTPGAANAVSASDPTPAAVDLSARLAVLDGLADRPLVEHPDVFQGLHAHLQAALAEIDSA